MNTQANARRNDPCPCGSGVKFKNCHGSLTGGEVPGYGGGQRIASAPVAAAQQQEAPAMDLALEAALHRHQSGDVDGAEAAYRSILDQTPEAAIPMHFLGVALWQKSQAALALPYIEQSLVRESGISDFHNNHALVLKALGRNEEAIAACRCALTLHAQNVSALNTLGLLLIEAGNPGEAGNAFEQALALHPAFLEARVNLSQAYFQAGLHAKALEQADAVLTAVPDQTDALMSRGQALQKLARHNEALQAFDQILRQHPKNTHALNGRAATYLESGDTARAEAAARQALAIDPAYGPAMITLGNVAYRNGDASAALQQFEAAEQLALAGDLPRPKAIAEARTNVGIASLTLGNWTKAWPAYTWRAYREPQDRDAHDAGLPPPLAASLQGQTLVLRGEQGLGDILFFLRFAAALGKRGATLIFRGDTRLAALLARTGLFARAIADHETGPKGAREIWAGDLPYLLGNPLAASYPPLSLTATQEHIAAITGRLQALGEAPKIALTWRSGTQAFVNNNATLFKSIAFEDLAPLLNKLEGTIISVQRNPEPGETAALAKLLGREVHDWSAINNNLDQTLALMALVDDYVGVSNTNTHLRAGTGKQATVIVPHPPEWRWMAEGGTSPWFPGVRIVRQQRDGRWPTTL